MFETEIYFGPLLEKRMAVFGLIAKLISTGKLKSGIQTTYSIDQIKDAVAAAVAGGRDGEILMVPNG